MKRRRRKRHLGFGGIDQVAVHFGLPVEEVEDRAERGEWPSYSIGGRRVFDLDELADMVGRKPPVEQSSMTEDR